MISSQMLKGMLEGCVLKIIAEHETYGYEISQKLITYGFGDISEGTIYPMLLRMSNKGFIQAEYRESSTGPRRKYFSLTNQGKEELKEFERQWKELSQAVTNLFDGTSSE